MLDATAGLDRTKYKVMLVWDPVRNKDVGWWTVPADSRLSYQHPNFQLRDVNLKCEGEMNSKVIKENVFQKSEETPSSLKQRSTIKLARNRNNKNANQNSDQYDVGGSPSKYQENKIPIEKRGSKSEGNSDLFENSIQPVLQDMNLQTKVNSATCIEKSNVYKHPKLSREVIATIDGTIKHLGPKIWQCKTCFKEFKALSESRRHAETHLEGQIHACGVCDRKFSSSSSLKGHRSYHQHYSDLKLKRKQDTTCLGCNKIFATCFSLKEHKEAVHDRLKFPCDCCQHMASSRRNLQGHKLKKHPKEKTSSQLHPIKMTIEENKKIKIRYDLRSHKLKMHPKKKTSSQVHPIKMTFEENKKIKIRYNERNLIERNYNKASWLQWVQDPDREFSTEAMCADRFEVKKCSVALGEPEDIQNALREQVKLVNKLKVRGLALKKSNTGDICYICGKKGSRQGIYRHKEIFHFMRGINCRICERRNMCTMNFKSHMMKHHP